MKPMNKHKKKTRLTQQIEHLRLCLTDSQYYEDGRSCFLYKSAPHFSTKYAAEGAHTAFTN